MGKLEKRLVAVLADAIPSCELRRQAVPPWLLRPGRRECGALWPLVSEVYRRLTGLTLPDLMRTVERRSLDVLITYPDGTGRVLEVDEYQHFNCARLTTLEHYADVPVAFDIGSWRRLCIEHADDKHRPGYSVEKPPLFPGDGGRTRQRAFRDFLADALPPEYGWQPTTRIARHEAETILKSAEPTKSLITLLHQKGSITN